MAAGKPASRARPQHGALEHHGELFGTLAPDEQPRAIREIDPDAPVTPRVEHPLAIPPRANAPAPVVGNGAVAHHLEAHDRGDGHDPAIGGDPTKPDTELAG